ncbi:MAG: MBL fold metallo-hydrolase [Bacteroidia bacterium]|nr:MBL fold metallo-hydrolase [Bacteroidia bacterium]
MKIARFTFNPFQENTYVLNDESGECVIIDPGCYDPEEKEELHQYILEKGLKPVRLLNTHCHIDHVLGNKFIADTFGLQPEIHPLEQPLLSAGPQYGKMYGIFMEPSPAGMETLQEGGEIRFGNSILQLIHAPGHSPGSICFYHAASQSLIGGDVLFEMSIGRSDLPGGDHDTLLRSIREKLFVLPGETVVHPGHGGETSIAFEQKNNPFLLAYS